MFHRFVSLWTGVVACAALLTACAGPPPRLFPVAPKEEAAVAEGLFERRYATARDEKVDVVEVLNREGRISLLRFDADRDGAFELEIHRGAPRDQDRRLIILVDSVPFDLVNELWQRGRFRLFNPPSRVISPYPVMTDLSFAEFFGDSPCPAIESEYFDGDRLRGGYTAYVHAVNAPWHRHVDYRMAPLAHGAAYFRPDAWFDHELHYIQKYFLRAKQPQYVGYCVCGSALGAKMGRDGHLAGLIRLDRLCQQIAHDTRGAVQITLMSDHGHNLIRSRRAPLTEYLARCGYRVTDRLSRPGDVVVPEFGVVTCAAIYTREPARVAADVVSQEAVEQAMYLDGTDVVVLDRHGMARISRHGDEYRYHMLTGDPLKLSPVIEALSRAGKVSAEGFIDDRAWFEATASHEYPDAVHRVWRAFHGLIRHQPDVMLTIADGWHAGSKLMSALYDVRAAHGNLGRASSLGFVMTTAGALPPIVRMAELRPALIQIGSLTTQPEP